MVVPAVLVERNQDEMNIFGTSVIYGTESRNRDLNKGSKNGQEEKLIHKSFNPQGIRRLHREDSKFKKERADQVQRLKR